MQKSLLYFQQVLYTRIALFFEQECEYDSIFDIAEPEGKWLERLVQRDTITKEERVILLLAMSPHLFPQSLDLFLIQNSEQNRPYTEFGGYKQLGYNGFLPTGETAVFILAGSNPFKRLEIAQMFGDNHWFHTMNIVELVQEQSQGSLLAGQLRVTADFLKHILEQAIVLSEEKLDLDSQKKELYEGVYETQLRYSEDVWTIEQARKYPCISCSALCCRVLHLESFPLQHFRDLDKIRYYLNFPNIEVLLSTDSIVRIYFSGFCSFLERETITCKVHNKPEQPNLCVHYSPYKCFYKKADADKRHIVHGKLWLNLERLDCLEQELHFNSQQEIVGISSTDKLIQLLNGIPYTECHEDITIPGESPSTQLSTPCSDCGGLCCSTLLFPGKKPETIQELDFIRYALGYPEVEYLVNRKEWLMKVNVKCKYLDSNNLCSIYEKPERPLHCRYYNPHKCTVKSNIRQFNVKVKLEQFNLIYKNIKMDNNGKIQDIPSLNLLKEIII